MDPPWNCLPIPWHPWEPLPYRLRPYEMWCHIVWKRGTLFCKNLVPPSSGQKTKTASLEAPSELQGVACIGSSAEWDRTVMNISRHEPGRRCSWYTIWSFHGNWKQTNALGWSAAGSPSFIDIFMVYIKVLPWNLLTEAEENHQNRQDS